MADVPQKRDQSSRPLAGTKYVNEVVDRLAQVAQIATGSVPGKRVAGSCVIRADSAATDPGKYVAFVQSGSQKIDEDDGVATLDGFTDGEQVLAIYAPDLYSGSNTLDLGDDAFYGAQLIGTTSDGLAVVLILSSSPAGLLTPVKTLSPGSGTTAATDTWNRDTDKEAVIETYQTREVWDGTANVLYYFTRQRTFDSAGALYSISAETRNTTDSAVSCS